MSLKNHKTSYSDSNSLTFDIRVHLFGKVHSRFRPFSVQCRTMTQWRKALLDQLAAVLEEYDLPESIDVNVLVQDSAPRQRVASNDAGAHEDESDAQRSAGCLFNLRIKPAAYAASATSRPVDRFLRQGRARAPRADDDDLFDNHAGRTTTSRREERLARFLRECSPPPRTSRSAAEPEQVCSSMQTWVVAEYSEPCNDETERPARRVFRTTPRPSPRGRKSESNTDT